MSRKLADWAVIGAEVISEYGGPEVIVRVSKTSVWTNKTSVSDPMDTRWIGEDEDRLVLHGSSSDGWASRRNFLYLRDSRWGKIRYREYRQNVSRGRIKAANYAFEKSPSVETAEALRDAVQKYLVLRQVLYVEDRLDAEEAEKSHG